MIKDNDKCFFDWKQRFNLFYIFYTYLFSICFAIERNRKSINIIKWY